jgi:two-component system, NtrC family, response regulator AtoC
MPGASNGRTILLGEDDREVSGYLETALKCQGYSIEIAQDGEEVLACLRAGQAPISAVVLDIVMPRRNGLEALKEIRRLDPALPVIMMSGAASNLTVAEAMKNGASDFIPKPVKPADLRKALQSAFESAPAPAPTERTCEAANKQILFGTSPGMRELQEMLADIGWSEAPVLIQGETGCGKEIIARELHARSPRAKKIILKLNCAALPSELVESELFGYERGAFTGAVEKKPGMFALADGGTIMLDEIGDMDFKLQAKLLQVLQDHEFQRLGGKDTIKVDVRVIAATHRDLEQAIADSTFRADLYYRLNVINIRVPPLRDRKEDIIPLAEFLAQKHSAPGAPPLLLSATLRDLFLRYDWPGNVRELENLVRRLMVLRGARSIEQELSQKLQRQPNGSAPAVAIPMVHEPSLPLVAVAPAAEDANGASTSAASLLEEVARANREAERAAIISVLKSTNWNRKQASVLLKVEYKALLYKMKKLSIRKEKAAPQGRAQAADGLNESGSQPLLARRATG